MRNPFKTSASLPPPVDGKSGGATASAELAKLFEDHNRALHSFLMMRTRNEQEAHEVAQEAYVRVLQLHRPGAVSFLKAYLFKTAANIVVDRARQRAAREQLDQREALGEEAADKFNPERAVMASEELSLLEQTLYELPPKYRHAFIRHRFDDATVGEIARELGINKRMARNYISRTTIYCKLRLKGMSRSKAKAEVMP